MFKKFSVLLSVIAILGMVLAACAPATAAPTTAPSTGGTVPTTAPAAAPYTCTDPIGCVKVGPTDPIHIAYLLVVAGPNAALGTDSRNGVQIAIDDAGGKILGHDIKFDGEDGGCSADGGQDRKSVV
jgi:branched-chain amino acid transport system substrate-binding protein